MLQPVFYSIIHYTDILTSVRVHYNRILIVGSRVFQVGFMNDGRILAADIQYYANAGNSEDESPLVGTVKEISGVLEGLVIKTTMT